MKKLIAFLKLIRFQNLLIVALTQLIVRLYLTEGGTDIGKLVEFRIWLIVFATVLIAAAGYIINDYYDIKIDAVNRPEKVLLGRKLKRRPLLVIHFLLNLTGIGMAVLLKSWMLLVIFIFSATLLWLYSNSLKRKPLIGNFSVAILSALAVSLPGIYFKSNTPVLLMYVLLGFTISLLREVVKDMEDIKGDKQFGCRTLPIVYGIRKTKVFLYLVLVAFVGIVLYTWIEVNHESEYLIFVVLPFSIIIAVLLYKADKKSDYKKLSLWCKVYMLLGVSSMFFL